MADRNDRSCDAFSETSLVAELSAEFGICYEDDLVAQGIDFEYFAFEGQLAILACTSRKWWFTIFVGELFQRSPSIVGIDIEDVAQQRYASWFWYGCCHVCSIRASASR